MDPRKHLLLTAEGWIYLLLSVLQMISEIVPAVRDNLNARRAFDTGIGTSSQDFSLGAILIFTPGVASFLPLFFYTFFFFIFTSNELLETLPNRITNIAKYSLVLFIPAIVVFNEIASFTGVVIRESMHFILILLNNIDTSSRSRYSAGCACGIPTGYSVFLSGQAIRPSLGVLHQPHTGVIDSFSSCGLLFLFFPCRSRNLESAAYRE